MVKFFIFFVHMLLDKHIQFMSLNLHNLLMPVSLLGGGCERLMNKKSLLNNNNNNILLL